MRSVLTAIAVLLCVGLTAQSGYMGELFAAYKYDATPDTLTNQDTVTHTLSGTYEAAYDYVWQVDADSLSGATEATASLQEAAGDTGVWITVGTITIDGVTTDERLTGQFYGSRQRMQIMSPSSTQSTRVKVYATLKKR